MPNQISPIRILHFRPMFLHELGDFLFPRRRLFGLLRLIAVDDYRGICPACIEQFMHRAERRTVTLIHVVEVIEVESLRVTKFAPKVVTLCVAGFSKP